MDGRVFWNVFFLDYKSIEKHKMQKSVEKVVLILISTI